MQKKPFSNISLAKSLLMAQNVDRTQLRRFPRRVQAKHYDTTTAKASQSISTSENRLLTSPCSYEFCSLCKSNSKYECLNNNADNVSYCSNKKAFDP